LRCNTVVSHILLPFIIYADKKPVPLDTRHSYTKLDWEIFAAAVASSSTKQLFTSKIAAWIGKTPTNRPLTDLYETDSGDYPGGLNFAARPVLGGVFAPLLVGKGPLG
jgi:hypothetical protein